MTMPTMALESTSKPGIYRDASTGRYHYRYRDPEGKWRQARGTMALASTFALQKAADERAQLMRAGKLDPSADVVVSESRRPIGDIIAEFHTYLLQTKANSPLHAKETKRYCVKFAEAMQIQNLAGVTLQKVESWLGDMIAGGKSHRTHNVALTAIKHLCRWAEDRDKIARSPLRGKRIIKRDEALDRRRVSRALTPEEFQKLLDAAEGYRAAFYLVAAHTGLRWREAARLTWACVQGEDLVIPPEITKTKQEAVLPMTADLQKKLAEWRKPDDKPEGLIFPHEPRLKTWRRDLIRAGLIKAKIVKTRDSKKRWRYRIEEVDGYVDHRGRIDRKCLRKSYGSWLAARGVDLRITQRLMRHRDPKITANLYTDPFMLDMRGAIEQLERKPEAKPGQSKAG